jgi:hypothetical protein
MTKDKGSGFGVQGSGLKDIRQKGAFGLWRLEVGGKAKDDGRGKFKGRC